MPTSVIVPPLPASTLPEKAGTVDFARASSVDVEKVKELDGPGRKEFLDYLYSIINILTTDKANLNTMLNNIQKLHDFSDPINGPSILALMKAFIDSQQALTKELVKVTQIIANVKSQWEVIDMQAELAKQAGNSPSGTAAEFAEEARSIGGSASDFDELPESLR